jgi:hypothetical protein
VALRAMVLLLTAGNYSTMAFVQLEQFSAL